MEENGSSDTDGSVENGPTATGPRVSTYRQVSRLPSLKDGYLQIKVDAKFPFPKSKWKTMYFNLRPRMLYYSSSRDNDTLYYEIDIKGAIIAESGNKNQSCCFELITNLQRIELSGKSRKDMDEWITAIKLVASSEYYEGSNFHLDVQGIHSWYISNHARPTFCNVCHKGLDTMLQRGVSCEVCKFKAHKSCASKAPNNCKWATLANVNKNVVEDGDGIWIKHQWLEGNLPVNRKCDVCQKSCGSVLKFQEDSRCLWCRKTVHSECRDKINPKCDFGRNDKSILPPTALSNINDDNGYWQAVPVNMCINPLLVFVNSKSGDSKGVLFLRRFRRELNPAQVFDLMCTGPTVGLKLFEKLDTFRVLVCGGDGSIGWVLTEMDKLNLHRKAVVGVLPLGTGNDLSQVLGWGSVCNDDSSVPHIIEQYESASTKMLDRWSVLTYDGPLFLDQQSNSNSSSETSSYEGHLSQMLETVLNSSKSEEVLDAADKLNKLSRDVAHRQPHQSSRFQKFNAKLTKFIDMVNAQIESGNRTFENRLDNDSNLNHLTNRANSIKKAFRTALDNPELATGLLSTPRISPSLPKPKSPQLIGQANHRYIPDDLFEERYVMNNYFGLGVDAKIVLEFHKKRDASPKSTSRYKNLIEFGKLGFSEIFSQTFRDLDKRIQLECDGNIIQLPSLQGIVIMNIPSYSGGVNFWGNSDNHSVFVPPSFNDKMFEVMAVYGAAHMALSQISSNSPIARNWHRICQCHSVRITIDEGADVPIQVDGEAWLQKPGIIKIQHKNRVQMLARTRSGSSSLYDGIDLTVEEANLFWSHVERINQLSNCEHGDSLKSLQRQLSEFDRKRHDHNEILTRIDVSQILTQLQQQKQSNAVTREIGVICGETASKIRDSFSWTTTTVGPSSSSSNKPGKSKNKCTDLPDDISNWTSDDVTVWVKSIGLRQDSVVALVDNDFKGSDLLGLDYHDLNSTINLRKEDSAKLIGELKQLRKLQDQRRKQQHNV